MRSSNSYHTNRGKVLLKLDFKNAFNSVERDCILKEVQCHTPLLYPYLYQCYRNPATLFFGNHLISSSVGAQQGDPCGPMIFSIAIQPIILSLDSELNIWYLDGFKKTTGTVRKSSVRFY
jgi:hypothetical protein